MTPTDLNALRARIDGIDAELVRLLGERFAATHEVGLLKAREGLQAVDAGREAAQRQRFETLAAAHGVRPELVQALFRQIIDEVVRDHRRMTGTSDFPVLRTPRLQLREIVDADAAALLHIHGNAEHMRWFGSEPLPDLAAAQALVRVFAGWRQQANPGTRWGLERHDAPGLVGSCGLFAWNRAWKKCSLGYELAPEACGQGLMDEALRTVIDWGFATMGLHRIEAQVHERNAPSLRLLQRLGFVHEGRLRDVGHWGGRHHDLLHLSLLRPDWAPAATPGTAGRQGA